MKDFRTQFALWVVVVLMFLLGGTLLISVADGPQDYEALLKQIIELEKKYDDDGNVSYRTIDALVEYHEFDIAIDAVSPQGHRSWQAVFVRQIAREMIKTGQVEEGLDVYRRLMPPRNDDTVSNGGACESTY